jgi:hypothetical protein
VNSLLTEYNLFTNENFILTKSLHVCMIRFVVEASMTRGGEELHEDNRKMVPIISESTREERKAGAPPLKKKSEKSFQSWLWQALCARESLNSNKNWIIARQQHDQKQPAETDVGIEDWRPAPKTDDGENLAEERRRRKPYANSGRC